MEGLKTALLTFGSPEKALGRAADERRFVWPLVLVTLVSIGFTALFVPRTDLVRMAEEQLDKIPETAKLTPHEREEKIESAGKVAVVGSYASAAVGPAFGALLSAFGLWLGFKVAGGRPGFVGAFAVAAHAKLPDAVHEVLSVPALLQRTGMRIDEAIKLLPSSLASLAPEGTPLPQLTLLSAVDVFGLWSVALLAIGMAHVAKVTLLRSSIVTFVLWASYVLVFRFALPSLGPGPS